MKARIKETGEIVDVEPIHILYGLSAYYRASDGRELYRGEPEIIELGEL